MQIDNHHMKLKKCMRCRNYLVHNRERVVCSFNIDNISEKALAVNSAKEKVILGCPLDPGFN